MGDVADGTGDGFQSWAEKDFNHTLSTTIHQAREWAIRTEAMLDTTAADADTVTAVQAHLNRALDARLLALSTTNFGLAAPVLHPDRVASATAYAELAHSEARAAFALIDAIDSPADGELVVQNPHPESGTVLVEATVEVPVAVWAMHGLAGVFVADGETALAAETSVVDAPLTRCVSVRFALPSTATAPRGAPTAGSPGTATTTVRHPAGRAVHRVQASGPSGCQGPTVDPMRS